jgi:PAS domain S-box-containing protein
MKNSSLRFPLPTVIIYTIVGGIWILLSDRFLEFSVKDVQTLTLLQTYKGWAFVLASAALLYTLLFREFKLLNQSFAERRQAEEALRGNQEQYERLVAEIPVGVYRFRTTAHKDVKFEYVSPRFCKMLGVSAEEVYADAQTPFKAIHPDDYDNFVRLNSEVMQTKQPFVWEGRSIVGGKIKWLHIESTPELLENGDVMWNGIQTDISDRMQSEKRFQTLSEVSPVGIFRTDTNGDTTYVNPRWTIISGLSGAEALGIGWLNAVHKEDRERLLAGWEKATQHHEASKSEYRFVRPDGTIAWVIGQAVPERNSDNQIVGYIGTVTDITERKQVEDGLQKSEDLYRAIFKNTGTATVLIEENMVISIANAEFEKLSKYSKQEIEGKKSWAEFVVKEDLDRMREQHLLRRDNEEAALNQYEFRFITREGNLRNILLTVDLITGTKKSVASLLDITDRKHAEEAIYQSEQRFKQLLESITDYTYTVEIQNGRPVKTVHAPSCEKVTGYTPADYSSLPKLWLQMVHPDDQKIVEHYADPLSVGKEVPALEHRIIHKNGSIRWVRNTYVLKHDADGNVIGYDGLISDITERKQAEEETKQLTQQLLKAEEIAHFGFLDWNLITNEIYLSPEINRIYGIPNDVLNVADFITKVVHPDDVTFVNENLGLAIKGIKEYNIDHRIIRPNGKVVWLNAQAELYMDENEKTIRLLGTILDITDRKLIEEEIHKLNAELEQRVVERTAQLETANKELEAFSYSVSHDLRAPLRHASGYVDLLVKKCKSDLSEKGQHYLSSIADSVRQMGTLIDDLLQFSRTSRQEMQQTDLDMNTVFQEAFDSIQRDNTGRNIEWITTVLPRVFADHALLRLVWFNLLSNAVKFTRTKEKAKIEIGVNEENKEYVFFVRDDGVGFDMQYAQKLFGVFQRLHSTEEFEGTGIGLANVRRIILKHGGRTWAEAKLDNGATFYFSLPKHKENKP